MSFRSSYHKKHRLQLSRMIVSQGGHYVRLPGKSTDARNLSLTPRSLGIPEDQFVTDKFPVFSYGATPELDLDSWRFRVFGLVEHKVEFTWSDLMALPQVTLKADFHCVTRWSHLNNTWHGVALTEILERSNPQPQSKFVMVHCYGGYTTNLAIDLLRNEEVVLAHSHDGKLLSPDHGWPLRLVIPIRYGWKSAKWVRGMEFLEFDQPGFWETRGYHMNGDPWKGERFSAGSFLESN